MEIIVCVLLALGGSWQLVGMPSSITANPLQQATLESVRFAQVSLISGLQAQGGKDLRLSEQRTIKRDPQLNNAPSVRGLYISAYTAGSPRMDEVLDFMAQHDLNALVIDVKEDYGYITYPTHNEKLKQWGTTKPLISDMSVLMERLSEQEIYPIARIPVFKDSVLATKYPEWAFRNPDGSLWDSGGGQTEYFLNPYREEVWDYHFEIAQEAVKAGFKEIQFDYIRFPERFESQADKLLFDADERSRSEVVTAFVRQARSLLNPLGVRVSVDIFGYAAAVNEATGIGQDFAALSKEVDIISPMIYPSHYSSGWYGAEIPDAEPYRVILGAMKDAKRKLLPLRNDKPIVRPWLQDFTATWVKGHLKYGKTEVEDQIRALKDAGIDEFLLWNARNRYTPDVDYGQILLD